MRLAIFSPLSPVRSAISDYTEGLLPHLAAQADVTIVTTGDYTPTDPMFRPGASPPIPWISYREFQSRSATFDLVIYQLGDEASIHGYMFDALARYPGLVVLHDLVLHHAVVGLTLARGDTAAYLREMRYSYGPQGEELAREVMAGRGDEIMSRYPLVERVLDRSLGIVGHNSYICAQVRALRPDLAVRRIVQHFFLPVDYPPSFDGQAFRRAFGLEGRPVVASFGLFIPDKRLKLALDAFRKVLRRHPEALYLLVGGHSEYYDLRGELDRWGLADQVRLTGWLPPAVFAQHMALADVAVQLRYPHIGGTPFTPIRLLGLGVPTIVSDIEPLADLPADAVARVAPAEPDEEELLVAAIDLLLTRRDVARAMAERGQRYVREAHDAARVCQQLVEFAGELASEPARPSAIRSGAETLVAAPTSLAQELTRLCADGLAEMRVLDPDDGLIEPMAHAIEQLSR